MSVLSQSFKILVFLFTLATFCVCDEKKDYLNMEEVLKGAAKAFNYNRMSDAEPEVVPQDLEVIFQENYHGYKDNSRIIIAKRSSKKHKIRVGVTHTAGNIPSIQTYYIDHNEMFNILDNNQLMRITFPQYIPIDEFQAFKKKVEAQFFNIEVHSSGENVSGKPHFGRISLRAHPRNGSYSVFYAEQLEETLQGLKQRPEVFSALWYFPEYDTRFLRSPVYLNDMKDYEISTLRTPTFLDSVERQAFVFQSTGTKPAPVDCKEPLSKMGK